MEEMEDKLNAVLSNPQLMQQIVTMAQSLGQQSAAAEPPPPKKEGSSAPSFDPSLLQKLSGLATSAGTDNQQQALLAALGPYLSHDRVQRLEKAMRAAKMAKMASAFLGSGALQSLTGR